MWGALVRFFRFGVATLAAAALAGPLPARAAPMICYVDVDAAGAPDGKSWATAWTNLHPALAEAECAEIWVAEGVYVPSTTDEGVRYSIEREVQIYGGFAGTETIREQRDWTAHATILSGDMGGDDINADGNHIAESPADIQNTNIDGVVIISGEHEDITSATVLDGFTITAGDAGAGGGVQVKAEGGTRCSPSLSHLTFSGNRALNGGGGLLINAHIGLSEASPTLADVTFRGNHADYGGAIANDAYDGVGNPLLRNVTFSNNSAHNIGGAFSTWANGEAEASPTLANVTFFGNTAGVSGGGMRATCVFDHIAPTCEPTLLNVTFSGNTADAGGGLDAGGTSGDVQVLTLVNVIMWGDEASSAGNEIFKPWYMSVSIGNSVIQGSGGSGPGWDDMLGTDKGGNVDADPMLGLLAYNGGYTQTMALWPGSSAIDAGSDPTCEDIYVNKHDQRGVIRPQRQHCDIGAYEADRYGISGNAGVGGATLSYDDGGPESVLSDSSGEYVFTVPPGWDGTVTPSKTGYLFTPDHRDYADVMADQPDQDYSAASTTPTIASVFPEPLSTSCRKPQVGVNLILADLVRLPSGAFNPATVTLKLDNIDRSSQATITQSVSNPASHATILYAPPSNLSTGSHMGTFIYPSAGGPVTYNWNFTVSNTTCPTSAPEEVPVITAASDEAQAETSVEMLASAAIGTEQAITVPAATKVKAASLRPRQPRQR